MSYEKDKELFKKKYGKDAVANSVVVRTAFLEKVRKQNRWILRVVTQGKIKFFNDGVKQLSAFEVNAGDCPQFNYIMKREALESLEEQINKILSRKKRLRGARR